ncbi:MAG: RHS repeat-associated core domain-containing protein [Myxococcales bacterium]|nr:RHS repeat-associated core domain-containing protein [Myxococcales bacterium]
MAWERASRARSRVFRPESASEKTFGARYYAPWLGRWTTADPLGLQAGLNLYLYGRASPVVMVDPNGTDITEAMQLLGRAQSGELTAQEKSNLEARLPEKGEKLSQVAPQDRAAWKASRTHAPAKELQLPDPEDANRTFQPSNALQWEIPEALKLPYAEVRRLAAEGTGAEKAVAYALHPHTGALAAAGETLDLPNDVLTSYESLTSSDPDPEGKGAWSFAKMAAAVYGGGRLLGPTLRSLSVGDLGKSVDDAFKGLSTFELAEVPQLGTSSIPASAAGTPRTPFVPPEYWTRYAPQQVAPGTTRVDFGRFSGRTGGFEESRVIYDEFGRQRYRLDKTTHLRPEAHSNPHLHEYEYGPGFTPFRETTYNFFSK